MKNFSNTFFEVSVKETSTDINGKCRRTSATYLAQADSFGAAEALILLWRTNVEIHRIAKATYAEIFLADDADTTPGDKFFAVRAVFITINESTMREQRHVVTYLVQASDIDAARRIFSEAMRTTVVDHDTISITLTTISDIMLRDQ